MKFPIQDYFESIQHSQGECINMVETETAEWSGFIFKIRDTLDEYDNVQDWRENYGGTTIYFYRNFRIGSPDVVRGEFVLWEGDYAGSEFSNLMIKLEKIIYIDDIRNKPNKSLMEQIAVYIDENADKF